MANLHCPMRMKRPQRYPYSFRATLDFPHRLMNPPKVDVKIPSYHSVIPEFSVNLMDILDNRHLPPLTLKDFEEFLLFQERSAENLYFMVWLRDYTKMYDEFVRPDSAVKSGDLALSFSRALTTFFTPGSNYELNLGSDVRTSIRQDVQSSSHPHPSTLSAALDQVEHMLEQSLSRFVRGSFNNARSQQQLFSICFSLSSMAIGLAPILVSILGGKSRWLRLAALPLLWLGAWGAVSGLNGICMIIYMFGDARQLYSFELATPNLSGPMLHQDPNARDEDEEKRIGSHIDIFTTAGFIKPYDASLWDDTSTIEGEDTKPAAMSPTSSHFVFDFDSLPIPLKRSSSEGDTDGGSTLRQSGTSLSSVPTFGSLTKVFSPIIARAQWEIVFRSALLALPLAIILQAIALAIPPRH